MNPLISVIVPVYNGRDYVINCIKSIEGQTYSPLEIIIIDDGSSDGTGDLIREYISSSGCQNLKLLSMDDKGVSAARNFGIKNACGELITFVDADDRLLPDAISVLYQTLAEQNADVAGCRFLRWSDENYIQISAEAKQADPKQADPKQAEPKQAAINNCIPMFEASHEGQCREFTDRSSLFKELLSGNTRCWSKLYRRDLLQKVSFLEGLTIGEDMLFLADLVPYVTKWIEIDYPGYAYFQNPKGAMERPFTIQYLDQIRCWKLMRERVLKAATYPKADAILEAATTLEADTTLEALVTRNLLIGILLVIGKISLLSKADRRKYNDIISECHADLCSSLKCRGAFSLLSGGYKVKTLAFLLAPGIYISLYHLIKHKL